MQVIDSHAHFFPDKVADAAVSKLEGTSGQKAFLDGTQAGLLGSMERTGIELSMVLPVATNPGKVSSVNRFSAAVDDPRLVMFGSLHPASRAWREELDELVSLGLPGVKLHPEYQEFRPDDPALLPFFAAIRDSGLLVAFHCGEDISYEPPALCTPASIAFLLESLPGILIFATHMGGFRLWDDSETWLIGRPVWMDTSFSLGWMPDDKLKKMISAHGQDYVMFGSDSPWQGQPEELERLKKLGLSSGMLERIAHGNAGQLLQLLKERF